MNHSVIWREKDTYSSFPSLAVFKDRLYCVFRSTPTRRSKTHIDTRSTGMLISSNNRGKSWAVARRFNAAKAQEFNIVQHAGLQDPVLSCASNRLILTHFTWQSLTGKHTKKRHKVKMKGLFLYSFDGAQWSGVSCIPGNSGLQFAGHGPIEESGLNNLLPVYADVGGGGTCCFVLAQDETDPVTHWSVKSRIAHDEQLDFTEPALMDCGNDHILCLLRGSDGLLYQSHSWNGGKTWEPHKSTGIRSVPASLCWLGNDYVLCTYGYRHYPYGIRACLSYDGGLTWDIKREIIIRADGGGWDIGYPSTVKQGSTLLTAYYFYTKRDKTRRIELTKWRL